MTDDARRLAGAPRPELFDGEAPAATHFAHGDAAGGSGGQGGGSGGQGGGAGGQGGGDGGARTPTSSPRRQGATAVGRHPVRAALLALAALVVALLAWAVIWYLGEVNAGPPGPQTIVSVSPGQSMGTITATLAHQQVVGSSLAFRIYLLLHGTPTVRSGDYVFRRHEAFGDVRGRLVSGPNVYSVAVLPGFTATEVASRVGLVPGHDSSAFLDLMQSGAVRSPYQPPGSTSLEGLLGTGQYLVLPGESDRALLGAMIDRFDTTATAVGLVPGAAALGFTPYEVITVASIVQKEGVYRQNLGKVSRVVYNRLARGTPLQMDSTVLYSENRDGGPVTSADLALNTPYNTYLHAGLTPTPICFPSRASLEAALSPTAGDWLYFVVVSKDGTEAFSDTFAGQQANERLAQSRGLG